MVKLGSDKNGWQRYYCTVCGHVEWVAPGEQLSAHYECPLCEAPRSAMLLVDDPRLARHKVEFKEIAPSVWQIGKSPLFRADFNHYSYLLNHPQGVILFDAPPLVTEDAIEKIKAIGKPRLLVVSHTDFVGFAGDWAKALDISSWMGEGDMPISGNYFEPDEFIKEGCKIADDLEVVRVPGHSKGSLAVYWKGSAAGDVLCCGDALTVWHHTDGRIQLAFLQSPPIGQEIEELASRPISLMLSCTGYLTNASGKLQRLLAMNEKCARPWLGETGGIWLNAITGS
jgi:glyoxylase-like metal-dependent hydrolase (beta-lactamase superfamily II)